MLNFVVDSNLPFSIIQSSSFSSLINLVAGRSIQIPSTTTFMNFLKTRYEEMKTSLGQLLSKRRYLCVTADVWSSRSQSYLGMTVHFLNESFERESFVLAFRQLTTRQTYAVLASEILKVFNEYSILVDRVTHIVTDGGSAFCKAFKIFGKSVDHLIDRANTSDDVDDMEQNMSPFIQYEDGEYFYSNIIQFGQEEGRDSIDFDADLSDDLNVTPQNSNDYAEDDEYDDFLDTENIGAANFQNENEYNCDKLPAHRRCVSHLLNLIPADFEKELSGRAKTALVSVLGKLQTIWVFPRRSSFAKTIAKEVLECSLKLPCETRWNSKFDAIKHIYELKPKMSAFVDKLKENIPSATRLPKLTNEDWLVIAAYLKVMEPVAASLDRLQGDKNGSQGFIMPTIRTMKYHISEIDGGNCTKQFKEAMLKVIDRRFNKFFEINDYNRELFVAAVSVPLFKVDFIEDDTDVEAVRRMLVSECIKLLPECNQRDRNESHSSSTNDNDEEFFLSFASRRSNRRTSIEQNINAELERYLNDDRKQYSMLNDYPNIRELFFKFNTTLASSGVVERVFSQSSLIFTPRRNRILASNFEYALLLKYNRNI